MGLLIFAKRLINLREMLRLNGRLASFICVTQIVHTGKAGWSQGEGGGGRGGGEGGGECGRGQR